MFGFFGADKKQDSPAPQPQNTPQPPQRIIEKEGINSWPESRGTRQTAIIGTFGTDDLDLVLERYAPDTMDKFKTIFENQQTIYDKLKEQDKKLQEQSEALMAMQEKLRAQEEWNERLKGNLDFLSGSIGEMYEAILKKQMGKEPENKIPQK